MIRRPPRSTRTDTLVPYTTLFRSDDECEDEQELGDSCGRARNAAEPQKSGNHCDNGENQCPFQHRKFLLTPGGTRKRIAMFQPTDYRSEERRVGKECVRPCRSRASPNH